MKHETEEILNSLDDIQRARMSLALLERIPTAMAAGRFKEILLRRPTILLMAAGLALLIGFNIYSLAARDSTGHTRSAMVVNPLTDEYFTPAPSI